MLLAVSKHGEWTAWVRFFLQGVAEQARDAVARAKELQDLQLGWRQTLAQHRASARALRLLDILFEVPVLTIPQAQHLLGGGYPSAQRAVERLVSAGILRQAGTGSYGKVFIAEEILKAAGHLEI